MKSLTPSRKPRNARSKRALDDREAKLVENQKKTLFLSGTTTSELSRQALGDLVRLLSLQLSPNCNSNSSGNFSTHSRSPMPSSSLRKMQSTHSRMLLPLSSFLPRTTPLFSSLLHTQRSDPTTLHSHAHSTTRSWT